MKSDNIAPSLDRLRFFVAVVEDGSFTAAAKNLKVRKAVVSHQISKLEGELGATLLQRTTRKVVPTADGQAFYEEIKPVLRDADQAFERVSSRFSVPAGTLRISAPIGYGSEVIVPAIGEYLKEFPNVKVELLFDDKLKDIIDQRFDLSIRIGWPKDSSNIMRKISDNRRLAVARPDLLAGVQTIEDLKNLPFISNTLIDSPNVHTFEKGTKKRKLKFEPVITSDSTHAIRAAVLNGIGFSIVSEYQVADDLRKKKLMLALEDWELPTGGIYAMMPPSKYRDAKTASFLEFLLQYAPKAR
ncbi:MAG: LysR substrate-binding domain-containing protein [Pseudomonadota bacterium]